MRILSDLARSRIERRFGGYRHQHNQPNPDRPQRLASERKVAVIGAGLAGLRAAILLAERGFAVDLLERAGYLGGKVGAWPVRLNGGFQTTVEHGFHAFFRHYYNLDRFLRQLGVTDHFRAIEDYLVIAQDGARYSFRDIETTPLLNILSMMGKGVYSLSDVLTNPRTMRLMALLQYHPRRTFERFDLVSFEDFAEQIKLPPGLRLTFNSFSRAFFAPTHKMSMAEVIKSFHFYFLSNAEGLLYDYPDDDYTRTLLPPMEQALRKNRAEILLERPVGKISRAGNKLRVGRKTYDHVVLAADVAASRRILEASGDLTEGRPEFRRQVDGLRSSTRYAVLRLWTDRDVGADLPGFVITDHTRVLDSVSFYHRLERDAADWVAENGGGIYELHSYSVPETVGDEAEVRRRLIEEFEEYFPEIRGCAIRHEHLQVRDDFTAFHVGMHRDRPVVDCPVPGLYLAGDWVKLPLPAMLMEAAATSGLLAANAILAEEGLREEPVFSVPPRGLFASA